MAINKQDWNTVGNAASILGNAAVSKYKTDIDYFKTLRGLETQEDIAEKNRENALKIAQLENTTKSEINAAMISANKELKQMGIDAEKLFIALKYANEKGVRQFQNELDQLIENLKNENYLKQLKQKYEYDANLADFEADEQLRRIVIREVGEILKANKSLTYGEIKNIAYALNIVASDAEFEMWFRQRNDASGIRGTVSDPTTKKPAPAGTTYMPKEVTDGSKTIKVVPAKEPEGGWPKGKKGQFGKDGKDIPFEKPGTANWTELK